MMCTCYVCIIHMTYSDSCMTDPALQRTLRHTACLCGISDSNHFRSAKSLKGPARLAACLCQVSCRVLTKLGILCPSSVLKSAFWVVLCIISSLGFFPQKHALVFVFQVMHAQHVAMSCWDCLQGDSWRIRGVGQVLSMLVASTPMPAQHLWTAEQGLEVSCISAAVCYAGVGRSRHVSCTWLCNLLLVEVVDSCAPAVCSDSV